MPTPHIEAKYGEIADTILLPGDPLRAKSIAERYLTKVIRFNQVRNMFGYTGFFKNKRVSVMGTGMGIPSMGIYSYELIREYGVKNLIRVGTAGALQEYLHLNDTVIAQAASTDSNFGKQYGLEGEIAAVPDFRLLKKAIEKADSMRLKYHVGGVLSSDIFYHFDPENWKKWQKAGVLCVEMEAYALFQNAVHLGASALAIVTISDSLVTGEELPPEVRQHAYTDIVELALSIVENN